MRQTFFTFSCIITLALSGVASSSFAQKTREEFGKCGYYADSFQGRPTSNGEKYDKNAAIDPIKEYDDTMVKYYLKHEMNIKGTWSNHSAKRVSLPSSLNGRDKLASFIKAKGFKLK